MSPPRRVAAVLVEPGSAVPGATVGQAPPGIGAPVWSRALIEDSYEVVAALAQARAGLAARSALLGELADLTWPDTVLIDLGDGDVTIAGGSAAIAAADALDGQADIVVLVAPDAPDIPGLHLGKLFQALENAALAWTPVADGGVAALGFRLPVADWIRELAPGLDDDPARWALAAPSRTAAAAGPGWHRLRRPGDLRHLDEGLSGWENTRALLSGHPLG